MAELLPPPELPVNGGTTTTTTTTTATLTDNNNLTTTKRQRRPSVRLGEIGDQSATLSCESYRRNKLWSDTRYRLYPSQKELITSKSSSSKTRALTNFANGHETLEPIQDGSHKVRDFKGKRGNNAKRVRSNWAISSSKAAEEGGGGFDKFSGDEWVRDYDGDGGEDRSESPLKEHSPMNSIENVGNQVFTGQRRVVGARRSESRDHGAVELEGPSDNDGREWRCRTSVEGNENGNGNGNGRCRSLEDGVRMWLTGLGLGQYEPLFEIHEVDEEVLPLLTLEDLKDMGINAVGSRRKLYSAIQKLGRGFS